MQVRDWFGYKFINSTTVPQMAAYISTADDLRRTSSCVVLVRRKGKGGIESSLGEVNFSC